MSCEYTAIRVHLNLRDVQADLKSQYLQRLSRNSPQRCWALSGIALGEMVSKPMLLLAYDFCCPGIPAGFEVAIDAWSRFSICVFTKELIGVLWFGVEMRLLLPFSIKAFSLQGIFPFPLTPAPDPHFYFILLPALFFQIASISNRQN